MGTTNHNAVIATTSSNTHIADLKVWIETMGVHEKPKFIFGNVEMNAYQTVVLVPDGSNENWDDSEHGDDLRQVFIDYLESKKFEDDSNCWVWVEVGFGDFGQKVLRGNNKNKYSDDEYCDYSGESS